MIFTYPFALDQFLLTSLHRRFLRWGIGSSGAEGLAPGQLTSSLNNSILIAPMPLSDMSVQPVPKSCLDLISSGTKSCTSGDHRMNRWLSVDLTGATDSASSCPICRSDHLDISNLLCFCISTTYWTWYLNSGLDMASR